MLPPCHSCYTVLLMLHRHLRYTISLVLPPCHTCYHRATHVLPPCHSCYTVPLMLHRASHVTTCGQGAQSPWGRPWKWFGNRRLVKLPDDKKRKAEMRTSEEEGKRMRLFVEGKDVMAQLDENKKQVDKLTVKELDACMAFGRRSRPHLPCP